MNQTASPTVSLAAWLYLALSVVGLLSTSTYNVMAFLEFGNSFTPAAFVRVGFAGSPILGSLAADFWVGATASTLWMIVEGRRLGIRHLWVYAAVTLGIAWAFGLPLFLFARERLLARQSADLAPRLSSQAAIGSAS